MRPVALLFAGLPLAARAQVACNRPVGPDLILSDVVGVANYAAANGRDAFSIGTRQTDVGDQWVNYIIGAPTPSAHPVLAQGLFRLSTVDRAMRFEQVGQSWVSHGICAVAANGPCATCIQPPDCSHLGVGCSSPDTASRAGSQAGLGPRWQVNPNTGAFPFPQASPPFSGGIARRLQARLTDLNLSDSFYVEALAVAADDASFGNQNNNALYVPVGLSGASTDYSMIVNGAVVPEAPAIAAWRGANPGVAETRVQVPGDGLLILSSSATPVGEGFWHYEYALYNMNADAGVGEFAVPLDIGYNSLNFGFHDVDYTDGDGVNGVTRDGTDWVRTQVQDTVSWATTPYALDPNANGLLWGTLYNFRFDSGQPPALGYASITLWKQPGVVLTVRAQVPAVCYVNCDDSTTPPMLNVQDFGCFLNRFASGDTFANCDGSNLPPILNVLDFACFINRFAGGCF
jgi:hypothetical protein